MSVPTSAAATPGSPLPAAAPTAAPPTVPAPPLETIRDSGAVQHDAVRALRWTSRGAAKVLGNVDVGSMEGSGLVSVGGTWNAQSTSISGSVEVGGAAKVAGALQLSGSSRFGGPLEIGSLEARGALAAAGDLSSGGLVHAVGELELASGLSAERFVGEGAVTIHAGITAGSVDLILHHDSRAEFVRARVVRIARPPSLLSFPLPFGLRLAGITLPTATFTTLRIDATEADLEGVSAEYVRADRIRLGRDCHIARLDGTIVARHPTAHVGPESRSPAPYGLRR